MALTDYYTRRALGMVGLQAAACLGVLGPDLGLPPVLSNEALS